MSDFPPLGKQLQTWREAGGLSQRDVARYLKVTGSTISLIETGKLDASPRLVGLISNLLRTPYDQVAARLAPRPRTPADQDMLSHAIALSAGRTAYLTLPGDITKAEAAKLAAIIDSLAN